MFYYFLFGCTLLLVVGGWLLRGVLGRHSWYRRLSRATAALENNWAMLEEEFLHSAAATGKPRGLIWKKSKFHDSATLVRDRATADLYALVGITIAFEATVGGGMEEVAAVSNLRCATALLEWRNNRWSTAGRVLFNLEPRDAIDHYAKHLEPIRQLDFT